MCLSQVPVELDVATGWDEREINWMRLSEQMLFEVLVMGVAMNYQGEIKWDGQSEQVPCEM